MQPAEMFTFGGNVPKFARTDRPWNAGEINFQMFSIQPSISRAVEYPIDVIENIYFVWLSPLGTTRKCL
ncbi:hypothetical protein D3C78_1932240 [compost metagenome]